MSDAPTTPGSTVPDGKGPDQVAVEQAEQIARLERENAKLRAQLEDPTATPAAPAAGRMPLGPPSFGISEGEREELEREGVTTSPWTGEPLEDSDVARVKREGQQSKRERDAAAKKSRAARLAAERAARPARLRKGSSSK